MLAKNLALARDLGAEVITTKGPDLAQAIQRIARSEKCDSNHYRPGPSAVVFWMFLRRTH